MGQSESFVARSLERWVVVVLVEEERDGGGVYILRRRLWNGDCDAISKWSM